MSELIEKLSNYNLFNYLLPGTVFVFLIETMTSYSLVHDNIVVSAFVFYFIGLIISRIGSLFFEPLLKRITRHAAYEDYVKASANDDMIKVLSEQNNVFRTSIAMLVSVLMVVFYEYLVVKFPGISEWLPYLSLTAMLLIFILAYKKQTQYVVKRIEICQEKSIR